MLEFFNKQKLTKLVLKESLILNK